jgi:hypothetical protein
VRVNRTHLQCRVQAISAGDPPVAAVQPDDERCMVVPSLHGGALVSSRLLNLFLVPFMIFERFSGEQLCRNEAQSHWIQGAWHSKSHLTNPRSLSLRICLSPLDLGSSWRSNQLVLHSNDLKRCTAQAGYTYGCNQPFAAEPPLLYGRPKEANVCLLWYLQ